MARDAPPTPGDSLSGLYEELLAAEEQEARRRERTGIPLPGNRTRLAAFGAGEPVDVCAGDLPAWARPAGERMHWWRRATVTAFGAVTFYDDDGSAWLAENGL
jgi:hypothetical protein